MADIGIEYHSVNVGGESGHEWLEDRRIKDCMISPPSMNMLVATKDSIYNEALWPLHHRFILYSTREKFSLVASLIHYNIKLQFK